MKTTKKINKKLTVNKTTIANLGKLGMSAIQGGKLWEGDPTLSLDTDCGTTTNGGGGGTNSCFTLQDCTY